MMRRLIGWTLAVLMTVTSFAPAALHQEAERPTDAGEGSRILGVAEGMAGGALEHFETDKRLLEAFGGSSRNAEAIAEAADTANRLGVAGRTLKGGSILLKGVEIKDHLSAGEWTDAGTKGLAALAEFGIGKALARTAFAGAARFAATALCTALSLGAGALVCLVVVGGAASYLASEAVEGVTDKVVDGGKRAACALFPGAPGCDEVRRQIAEREGQKAGGGSSLSGRSGAGGGGRSTQIDAQARDIVTVATGGGEAVTEVGVSSGGGGRITAIAGDIVTIGSAGKSARTTVGAESGTTIVKGEILNFGGVIDVNNNTTKRDGKRCLTFYMNTCIIHILYRRPSDPCPPGYWPARGRQCLLPSDLQHRMSR